jgi:hypothetical protein
MNEPFDEHADRADGDDSEIEKSAFQLPQLWRGLTRYIEIPKILFSTQNDAPFDRCIHCGRNLLASNQLYLIEKVFRGTEPIIEMAMCVDCREGQCGEGMSAESAAAIRNHFDAKVDITHRIKLMSEVNHVDSIDPWIERCLLSDQPRELFNEYQVVAICRGDKIQRDFFPAFLSGPAMEEVSELLSEKTRDWMDDYIGSNFGMPSEFCEPPSFTPLLL